MFIEELKSSVNQLMANLESMPVSKGGEFKLQKMKRGHNTSIIDMGQEDENTLSKSDVVLSFTLEVQCIKNEIRYNEMYVITHKVLIILTYISGFPTIAKWSEHYFIRISKLNEKRKTTSA